MKPQKYQKTIHLPAATTTHPLILKGLEDNKKLGVIEMLRRSVDSPAVSDLTFESLRTLHQLLVQRRQQIDNVVSELHQDRKLGRHPYQLQQALWFLVQVRSQFARIDLLIRHPERIRDPGELANLLLDARTLVHVAQRAINIVRRSAKTRRQNCRQPCPNNSETLH